MLDEPSDFFDYLAFDRISQRILGHGKTSESACQWAGEIASTADLEVLLAGAIGKTIWNRGFSLHKARRALEVAHFVAQSPKVVRRPNI